MVGLDISKIVNTSILQDLPEAFYDATGLITAIQNLNGELLTSIPRKDFCKFCHNMMFGSMDTFKRCHKSNAAGAKQAYEVGGPFVYHCHAGLVDVAAPIIVNGYHVGSVECGQILLRHPDDHYRARVRKLLAPFPSDFIDAQIAALDEVTVIPLSRVRKFAQLLYAIANAIVDLIINHQREKELNDEHEKQIDRYRSRMTLEKQISDSQLRLKEAELKALEAQVNPHFLYNTLDTIQWLAVLDRSKEIQQISYALGQLLRRTLDKKSGIVTLREELEQVRNYLFIQKMRFGGKLTQSINVESSIMDFHVPKLVLQPLVENAILHGLEPKSAPGNIWIRGWLHSDDQAMLEVSDDGVGMSPEVMEELSLMKLEDFEAEAAGYDGRGERINHPRIGILNVQKRLTHYFGKEYGLEVRTNKDAGTTVIVRFPRFTRKEAATNV